MMRVRCVQVEIHTASFMVNEFLLSLSTFALIADIAWESDVDSRFAQPSGFQKQSSPGVTTDAGCITALGTTTAKYAAYYPTIGGGKYLNYIEEVAAYTR